MLTPLPNLPAKNCRFTLKSVAHVKPWRPANLTPEEEEQKRLEYFQRLSGERDRKTNELREKVHRKTNKARRTIQRVKVMPFRMQAGRKVV